MLKEVLKDNSIEEEDHETVEVDSEDEEVPKVANEGQQSKQVLQSYRIPQQRSRGG